MWGCMFDIRWSVWIVALAQYIQNARRQVKWWVFHSNAYDGEVQVTKGSKRALGSILLFSRRRHSEERVRGGQLSRKLGLRGQLSAEGEVAIVQVYVCYVGR